MAIEGKLNAMTALIIDTSGPEGFVVVATKGRVDREISLPSRNTLSQLLFPIIQVALCEAIPNFIACGVGPGSLTGTRVGCITAKGFAYAWHIPLLTFSSSWIPRFKEIAKHCYDRYQLGEDQSQIQMKLDYIPLITL